MESDDPTLKRYGLTESGIQLLEEYGKFEPNIRSRYHSIQKIFWKLFEGMDEALFEAYSKFVKAIEEVHFLIKDNPEASSIIQEHLLDASKKVEKIHEELKKQN